MLNHQWGAEQQEVGGGATREARSVSLSQCMHTHAQVYLYVRLPTAEAQQARALVGSPFDLDVLAARVEWSASSIICGRVKGSPWPDVCSDGA